MARRRASTKTTGRFVVTAPGEPEKLMPSVGAGLSLASTYASRATGPMTAYVREITGRPVGMAERDADGNILVFQL